MKLKSIRFIFENCETFEIDAAHIGEFYLDGIHHHFRRISPEVVMRVDEADDFAIEIFKEANEPYKRFCDEDTMYKFDRILHYDDVTSIEVIFEEEKTTYNLKWDNPYQEENPVYQLSYLSYCGHLYLKVSDKPLVAFFDTENLNDSTYMTYHRNCFGMEE